MVHDHAICIITWKHHRGGSPYPPPCTRYEQLYGFETWEPSPVRN